MSLNFVPHCIDKQQSIIKVLRGSRLKVLIAAEFKVLFIKNFPLLAYSSVTITTASYFSSRSQSTWTKHFVALNKSLAINP